MCRRGGEERGDDQSLVFDYLLTKDPRRVALGLGRVLLRQCLSVLWNW